MSGLKIAISTTVYVTAIAMSMGVAIAGPENGATPSTTVAPVTGGRDDRGVSRQAKAGTQDGHAHGTAQEESKSPPTSTKAEDKAPLVRNVTGPTTPVRQKECDYWAPDDVNINHQRLYKYADLPARFRTGDVVGYVCRYTDNLELESQGTFIYNQTLPPDAPIDDRLANARMKLQWDADLWFPVPTATGKPSLMNQRVGFESWLAVTGLDVPPTDGEPEMQLHAEIGPAYFEVPVRDGPTKVEKFSCAVSGIGADGQPNGKCAHRFDYATNGVVQARLSITYTVTMSSTVTGEQGTYVGTIERVGNVDMQVKDLQARAG